MNISPESARTLSLRFFTAGVACSQAGSRSAFVARPAVLAELARFFSAPEALFISETALPTAVMTILTSLAGILSYGPLRNSDPDFQRAWLIRFSSPRPTQQLLSNGVSIVPLHSAFRLLACLIGVIDV